MREDTVVAAWGLGLEILRLGFGSCWLEFVDVGPFAVRVAAWIRVCDSGFEQMQGAGLRFQRLGSKLVQISGSRIWVLGFGVRVPGFDTSSAGRGLISGFVLGLWCRDQSNV